MFYRKFSLISLCHDRWNQLAQSFVTWVEQDYPSIEHIIVVAGDDDAPQSITHHERFAGTVVRVRNAPAFRPSRLRNIAARIATGEYLGFVDADLFMTSPQWVSHCVESLRRRADLVVGKSLYDGADSGGSSGSCVMSRWLFEKIRGYNENLDEGWGYEDTDLYVRAQRAGGRISWFPDEMVQHQPHDDEMRSRHFRRKDPAPRSPKSFLVQMRICDLDDQVHPFEANRVVRSSFLPETVTRIDK